MTTTSPATLAHVASRFGLGARPDKPITGDPMVWLTQQLGSKSVVAGPSLDSCMTTLSAYMNSPAGSLAKSQYAATITMNFHAEQQAYMLQAVTTASPFQERLVRFWTNHFAIQATNMPTMSVAGAFVRDVIRPNVGGTFTAMLQAAIQHPALLYSLSNTKSVGPTSTLAVQQAKRGVAGTGINENLGRETLELFTVGIQEGYTQTDVDSMAYLLTGFSVNMAAHPYGFAYNINTAQKGLDPSGDHLPEHTARLPRRAELSRYPPFNLFQPSNQTRRAFHVGCSLDGGNRYDRERAGHNRRQPSRGSERGALLLGGVDTLDQDAHTPGLYYRTCPRLQRFRHPATTAQHAVAAAW